MRPSFLAFGLAFVQDVLSCLREGLVAGLATVVRRHLLAQKIGMFWPNSKDKGLSTAANCLTP